MYGSSQSVSKALSTKDRAEAVKDIQAFLAVELRDWRPLAFGLCCALILAIVNPTALNEFTFWMRVQFLVILVLLGRIVDYHLLPRFVPVLANQQLPLFLSLAATALVSVFLFSVLVAVWMLKPSTSASWMFSAAFGVTPLMFFYSVIMRHPAQEHFLRPFRNKAIQQLGWYRTQPLPVERIAARLPFEKRGQILSLRKKGQHVEVHTTKGTTLLSGSLSQFIQETDPNAGFRIHRSIWIRWDQITRLYYFGGNPRIRTKTGDDLPVSRSVVAKIKSHISNG